MAVRAVRRQLADHDVVLLLTTWMTLDRRRKHRPVKRYLVYTIQKARQLTGVVAPGVWVEGQFDPDRVPWANSV